MGLLAGPSPQISAIVAEFLSAWAVSFSVLDDVDEHRQSLLASAGGDRTTRQVLELLGLMIATRRGFGGGEEEIVSLLGEFRDRSSASVPGVAQVLDLAALVVGGASPSTESRHDRETVATLTKAELRVAVAVSAGRSNREAAETLSLSVRTVESHLLSVFRKLGVRNRTELAVHW